MKCDDMIYTIKHLTPTYSHGVVATALLSGCCHDCMMGCDLFLMFASHVEQCPIITSRLFET